MYKINPLTVIGALSDEGELFATTRVSCIGGCIEYSIEDAADAASIVICIAPEPEIVQIKLYNIDYDCGLADIVQTYNLNEDFTLNYNDESKKTASTLLKTLTWQAVTQSLIYTH